MSFTPLQKLIYLQRQLSRDEGLSYSELQQRDRRIGLAQGVEEKNDPDRQVSDWLSKLVTPDDLHLAEEVESGHRLINIGISLLGLLLGWLAIIGLFQYDGQGRVNLVYLLVVLVVFQLCLILLTFIAMLPQSKTSWLPGFSSFQKLLKWFSPGRLQKLFSRFMPASEREGISQLLGRHKKVFADIGKWQVFSWSQLFGVAFNSAALLTIFILIATRDVAFGWSSTLDIQPAAILQVTDFLSWPWHSWLPLAVPDLQLVEASHYFRLQNGAGAGVDAEILGHWWPFVMISLAIYGLLPRLLLLLFCRFQLRSAYSRTLQYFPGRRELLSRLNSALIETRASEHEGSSTTAEMGPEQTQYRRVGESVILINWSGLELDKNSLMDEIQALGEFTSKVTFRAGVNCKLEVDEAVIKSVSQLDTNTPISIIVKAWEPPLGELADFIGDLRQPGATQRMIYLLPVAVKAGQLVQPVIADLDEWQRFSKRLVDPWVAVIPVMPVAQE